MTLLHPGDKFPALTVALPGGDSLQLPDALNGHYGVVLFYRGSWCPYCNAQLSAFQRAREQLTDMDAQIIALSADDEPATVKLIAKHDLEFPVGHSADTAALAAATGAFVNDEPVYLQSTGFVLDPGGRVVASVYSSGAIGRLVPEDVIGLVDGFVSAEDAGVYKPHPGIYRHLLAQAGTEPPAALLVSCNPFDIAGAGATGMRTAWCKRQPDALFDPWGPRPDYVISSLSELASILPAS